MKRLIILSMVVTMLTFMVLSGISMGKKGGGGKPPKDEDPPTDPNPAIVYIAKHKSGVNDIMVMDADGINQTLVLSGSFNQPRVPNWSPVGTHLVYFDIGPDCRGLSVIEMDENGNWINAQQLVCTDTGVATPEWSPDTDTVAYFDLTANGDSDIFLVDFSFGLDGSITNIDIENLTNTPNFNESHPTWSPDLLQIAAHVTDHPFDSTTSRREIRVYSVNSTDVTILNLPEDFDRIGGIKWANMNALIAFHARVEGKDQFDIWCVDVECASDPDCDVSMNSGNLTAGNGGGINPSWSPDDFKIVFERDGNIVTMDVDTPSVGCPTSGSNLKTIAKPKGKINSLMEPDWRRNAE